MLRYEVHIGPTGSSASYGRPVVWNKVYIHYLHYQARNSSISPYCSNQTVSYNYVGWGEWVSTFLTAHQHNLQQCHSRWKMQDRRQIKKTDDTETKHNPEKANNTKHSKTKLTRFSRLWWRSARKWGGQCPEPTRGSYIGELADSIAESKTKQFSQRSASQRQ